MFLEVMKFGKEERVCCTSLDVAEEFGKHHDKVMRDIRELSCSKEFYTDNFVDISYVDTIGRTQKACAMAKNGFVLLVMGYTGEKAMKFKEAYIKQFDAMEKELQGKLIERQKGIVVRQALTSVIQQLDESKQMHGFAYSNYTNCIYKVLFGMNAKQLREKYGIDKKENLRDCFTSEELKAIQTMEFLVTGLIGCGKGYDEIKEFICSNNSKLQITG